MLLLLVTSNMNMNINFGDDDIDIGTEQRLGETRRYAFSTNTTCSISGAVNIDNETATSSKILFGFDKPFDMFNTSKNVYRESTDATPQIKTLITKMINKRLGEFVAIDFASGLSDKQNRIAKRTESLKILEALYEHGPTKLIVRKGRESPQNNNVVYAVEDLHVPVGNSVVVLNGVFTKRSDDMSSLQVYETVTQRYIHILETQKCTSVTDMVRKHSICILDAIEIYQADIEMHKKRLEYWKDRYTRIKAALIACLQQQ